MLQNTILDLSILFVNKGFLRAAYDLRPFESSILLTDCAEIGGPWQNSLYSDDSSLEVIKGLLIQVLIMWLFLISELVLGLPERGFASRVRSTLNLFSTFETVDFEIPHFTKQCKK